MDLILILNERAKALQMKKKSFDVGFWEFIFIIIKSLRASTKEHLFKWLTWRCFWNENDFDNEIEVKKIQKSFWQK